MVSGLVLNYLNGECFVIRRGYETARPVSSSFCLTIPALALDLEMVLVLTPENERIISTDCELSMTNLLNAFPLASFIVGQDGYVVGANEQALDLFGKEIIGHTSMEVVRNPNVHDAIERALVQKTRTQCDWSTTQATTDAVYHVTASWIEAEDILVTFKDVSDIEHAPTRTRNLIRETKNQWTNLGG